MLSYCKVWTKFKMADAIDEQFSRLTVVVLKKKLAKLKFSVATGNKAELYG